MNQTFPLKKTPYDSVRSDSALALSPAMASASEVIAHRGLFYDVTSGKNIAENSYESIVRAYDLGMRGVELDLRLDEDANVEVTHDLISNRTTEIDNANRNGNPVDVALNIQKPADPIKINSRSEERWKNIRLKSYSRSSRIIYPGSSLLSLFNMFDVLRQSRSDIVKDRSFMIILDVQDPSVFLKAAALIKRFGMQDNVYLKFFASKALLNNTNYTFNGADTCYVYAKRNNLTGLNIIPQINDGELDIAENNDTGINAFQRKLSIEDYLSCWATAQRQHTDAAKMPIVSASVPADNIAAVNGAYRAISWAKSNNRRTMTIVPNPDAGRLISNKCQLFSFQSNNVVALGFNMAARNAKTSFAADPAVNPTYIIWDVMGDVNGRRYYTNFDTFTRNLC